MPVKIPRDYQAEAIACVTADWADPDPRRAVCVENATGTGKTMVGTELGLSRIERGRCMVLTHSSELVRQWAQDIYEQTGERPAIEAGEEYSDETDYHGFGKRRFVVAMVQSMIAERQNIGAGKRRMHRFDAREFATVIVDEVHRYGADLWSMVPMHFLDGNPDLRLCGITATAKRSDNKSIRKFVQMSKSTRFKGFAYRYTLTDGIRDGWLIKPVPECVIVENLDFSKCKVTGDDFDQEELGRTLEGQAAGIAKLIVEKTHGLQTIIYGPTVEYCRKLCDALNAQKNGSAVCVFGTTEKEVERPHLIEQFRWGNRQFILNVNVFTEGFNVPGIACVVPSPTKSFGRLMQQIGRGTRPIPGIVDGLPDRSARLSAIAASEKPTLLVLDIHGTTDQHNMASVFDIFKGQYSPEVVERAKKKAKEDGKAVACEDALALAAKEIEAEKRRLEAERCKPLRDVEVTYRIEARDPFKVFDLKPPRKDAARWAPKPTEKMVARLQSCGVSPTEIARMTRGDAGRLINEMKRRDKVGLCDIRTASQLRAAGYRTDLTKREAASVLASLDRPSVNTSRPSAGTTSTSGSFANPNGPCNPNQARFLASRGEPTNVTFAQAADAIRRINAAEREKRSKTAV